MISDALNSYKAELLEAKRIITPQIEGLNDFSMLDLHPDTAAIVAQVLEDFQRRLTLINTSLDSLDALLHDNYPNVEVRTVLSDVYSDLKANVATIEAAFAKFEAIAQAQSVEIKAGTPEPK